MPLRGYEEILSDVIPSSAPSSTHLPLHLNKQWKECILNSPDQLTVFTLYIPYRPVYVIRLRLSDKN